MKKGDSFFVKCADFKYYSTHQLLPFLYKRIVRFKMETESDSVFRMSRNRELKGVRVFRVD